ncbi:short-chain fatty acyl-CoA regulator family protein [Aquabacter cavernae]|uniref:short-chain fatty acyl-CoA regulator family protein n=1 Tax=Aquabacter cavernae TaxID=2496029 RepID=UPI003B8490A3
MDRAGNISEWQSATDIDVSRGGGICPLWNVYEALARPGRILTQVAQMPDGRTYLWIARTVHHAAGRFLSCLGQNDHAPPDCIFAVTTDIVRAGKAG